MQRLVDAYKQVCMTENRMIIFTSFIENKDLTTTSLLLKYQDGNV
jgi:hypothetical protein